MVIRPIHQIT